MKKPRIEGKRRHVYFYVCLCGRKRVTFDHTRAAKGECVPCEHARLVNEGQATLL